MANYKKASVIVVAESTASDTIPNSSSATAIRWTVTADQINYAAAGTTALDNPPYGLYQFKIPYTGFYQINFSLSWPATTTSGFAVIQKLAPDFALLSTLFNGAQSANEILNASRVVKLTKDDVIGVYCTQTSGTARIPVATLSIVRVGNAS
jgi:hypothetical protein